MDDQIGDRHVLTIIGHGPHGQRRYAHCSCGQFDVTSERHPDELAADFAVHVAADTQPSLFSEEAHS